MSLAFIDAVVQRDLRQLPPAKTTAKAPSVDELDAIELPDYGLIKTRLDQNALTQDSPKTPDEAERSQSSTPSPDEMRSVIPSWSYPEMNKWRHLSACLEYFGNGLNDAAPGALIPYIESSYGIGYAVVALIWVTNAVGFICAAFCTDFIDAKLGRARSLMLSEAFMIGAYIIIACPVPFPAVVVAFFFLGFGQALILAMNNVFCCNLSNPTVMIGHAHGAYGVGGIVGPIIATTLVSNGVDWHRFYLIPIAVRVLCMAATGWSFWNYEKEETARFSSSLVQISSRQDAAESNMSKSKAIGSAFKHRTTIIGAMFIFAYQGIEVSESGWFISYLITYRHADPAHVGFVTSGFWAGITVGRFVLSHAARRIGEKRFVFGLSIGVIAFQLLAWLIPNVIGDSVAVAIVGLLLGPICPCAQTIWSRLLPGPVQVFAIGFISSAGSSGGAVVPFLTGLLSSAVGTWVLHPICIGFCLAMIACWVALPRLVKRTE